MRSKIKKRWILLGIAAVLIGLLAALAFWQRENIQAVRDFASYTQEELEDQLAQNDQTIKDMVNTLPDLTVRDMTEEERQALRDGTLTQEELADRLLNAVPDPTPPAESTPGQQPDIPAVLPEPQKPIAPQPSGSAPQPTPDPEPPVEEKPAEVPAVEEKPAEDKPAEQPSAQDNYQKELSALVAKVYVLREEYLIALDNLKAEAIADYKAMAKEERSGAKLADFVSRYLSRGTALEKECDRRMDAIVVAMESLIQKYNGDMSIVDTVITTYANEKRLKKAWYISELEKKGLI